MCRSLPEPIGIEERKALLKQRRAIAIARALSNEERSMLVDVNGAVLKVSRGPGEGVSKQKLNQGWILRKYHQSARESPPRLSAREILQGQRDQD